jgi:hypothetical protein
MPVFDMEHHPTSRPLGLCLAIREALTRVEVARPLAPSVAIAGRLLDISRDLRSLLNSLEPDLATSVQVSDRRHGSRVSQPDSVIGKL